MSYSYADGFSGSVGVGLGKYASAGISYSDKGGWGVKAGLELGDAIELGVSYSEQNGFGASMSLSATSKQQGVKAGLSLGYTEKGKGTFGLTMSSTKGSMKGFNAGINYSEDTGWGMSAGYSYSKKGSAWDGSGGKLTYSEKKKAGFYLNTGTYGARKHNGDTIFGGVSAGLSFNKKDGFSGSVSVGGTNAFSYNEKGGLRGNRSFMYDYGMNQIKERQLERQAATKKETLEKLDEKKRKAIYNRKYKTDDSALTGSRTNLLKDLVGNFMDEVNQSLGVLSDKDGYIDEKGNYVQRICFVAGTLVRTQGGYKEIQDIKAGDFVLAWNEKSGELGYQPVRQTFVRKADRIWKLTYEDGTVIETTWSHPFYIDGRGWVMAKDLKVGDRSYTSRSIESSNPVKRDTLAMVAAGNAPPEAIGDTNGRVRPLRIAVIEVLKRDETVYNFEVAKEHNYFVSKADVLVHNEVYKFSRGYHKKRMILAMAAQYKMTPEEVKKHIKFLPGGKVEMTGPLKWKKGSQGYYNKVKSGKLTEEEIRKNAKGDFEKAVEGINNGLGKGLSALGDAWSALGDAWCGSVGIGCGSSSNNSFSSGASITPAQIRGAGRNRAIQFLEANKPAYVAGNHSWSSGSTNDGKRYNNVQTIRNDDGTFSKVYRNYDLNTGLYTLSGIQDGISNQEYRDGGSPYTTCNVTATAFSLAHGGPSLIRPNGTDLGTSAMIIKLRNNSYRGHNFRAVGFSEAERHARNGGFSLAIINSHVGVLTGGYANGNRTAGNLNTYQSGRHTGRMTLSRGFGNRNVSRVEYFIYLGRRR